MRTELRKIRESRGYTQELMAKAIGMTPGGYRAIELGNRDGTVETWRAIVETLGIHGREAWKVVSEK